MKKPDEELLSDVNHKIENLNYKKMMIYMHVGGLLYASLNFDEAYSNYLDALVVFRLYESGKWREKENLCYTRLNKLIKIQKSGIDKIDSSFLEWYYDDERDRG